jgi:hypothetical protein
MCLDAVTRLLPQIQMVFDPRTSDWIELIPRLTMALNLPDGTKSEIAERI